MFEVARTVMMAPNGHADRHLSHFFDGNGADLPVDLRLLMNEDRNVKARIELELLRRISPDGKVQNEKFATLADQSITIFQSTYENKDWKFALGTFPIDWRPLRFDGRYHYFQISGRNSYQWHEAAKRITIALHQAGQRLADAGVAKNFDMVAQPITIMVSEQNRKLVEIVAQGTNRAFKPAGSLKSY